MPPNSVFGQLLIKKPLAPIDSLAFNTFYAPLIGADGVYLYQQLINFAQILQVVQANKIVSLQQFLAQLNWSEQQFHTNRVQLEELDLLTTQFTNYNNQPFYFLQLVEPLALNNIKNSPKLQFCLQKQPVHVQKQVMQMLNMVCEADKLLLPQISGHDFVDISANQTMKEIEASAHSNLLSQSLKDEFYDLIYASVSRPFSVDEHVYHLIYSYCVLDQCLDLHELALLAYKAMIKRDRQLMIDSQLLETLIHERLNLKDNVVTTVNVTEALNSFWCNLIHFTPSEFELKYVQLFANQSPENFYQHFYPNKQLPVSLVNWIKSCTNHGFDYALINFMISFTKVWIKRINVRYLEKLSETCNELHNDLTEVFNHFKSVISDDCNKQNRLNLQQQPNEYANEISIAHQLDKIKLD